MRGLVRVVILVAVAAAAWKYRGDLPRFLPAAITPSAHERYAAAIRSRGLDDTHLGRRWLESAEAAVMDPHDVRGAFTHAGTFRDDEGASAWRFSARRGQRISAAVEFEEGQVFVDLLDVAGMNAVASSTSPAAIVTHDVGRDGEFLLRVQPELLRGGPYQVTQSIEASLDFPLRDIPQRAVQGRFGDPRSGGSRSHEGIDIFAPRGTPAVAALDGWITGSATNRLGGNVVWLWSPSRRLSLYYAHLDRHAVARGDRVRAGDVVGYVGTTGNARGTPPHLHFGIYARGEGAIDPAPFVVDPVSPRPRGRSIESGGERLMQPPGGKHVRNR
jgi:murein DD-endopeptidase MepM/ murein hydrolase activator NlpD